MAPSYNLSSYGRNIIFYPYGGLQYTAVWDVSGSSYLGGQTSFKVRCFFQVANDKNYINQLEQWKGIFGIVYSNPQYNTSEIGRPTLTLLNSLETDGNTYISYDFNISGTSGSQIVDFSDFLPLVTAFKSAGSGINNFKFNIYAYVVDNTFNGPIFYKVNLGGNLGFQNTDPYDLGLYTNNYDTTGNLPMPYPELYNTGGETNDYGQIISFKCHATNAVNTDDSFTNFSAGINFNWVGYEGYSNYIFYYFSSLGFGINLGLAGTVLNTLRPRYDTSKIVYNFSPVNPEINGTTYMFWNAPYPTPIDRWQNAVWGETIPYTKTTITNGVSNTEVVDVTYPIVPPPATKFARNVVFYPETVTFALPDPDIVGKVQNLTLVSNSVRANVSFKVTWNTPSDYVYYSRFATFVKFIVVIRDEHTNYVYSTVFNDNSAAIKNGAVLSSSPLTVPISNVLPNTTYTFSVITEYLLKDGAFSSNPTTPISFTTTDALTYPPEFVNITESLNKITLTWDYNSGLIPPSSGGISEITIYLIENLVNDGIGAQTPAPDTSPTGYLVSFNADGSDPKTLTITDLPRGNYYPQIVISYISTNIKDYYTGPYSIAIPNISTSVSTPKILENGLTQVNPSDVNGTGIKIYVTPSVYTDPSDNTFPASYYTFEATNTDYYFKQAEQQYNIPASLTLSVSSVLSTDTDGNSYYFWPSSNTPTDNVTLQNGVSYQFKVYGVYSDVDGNTYKSSLSDTSIIYVPVSKIPDIPSGLTGSVNGSYVTLYVNKDIGLYGNVTAGYYFNFNNPSLPIFDSSSLISGNGPNNTNSYYIPQSLDIGSYTIDASAYGFTPGVQSDKSDSINLEIAPQTPPDITSVKVFPGQNTFSVYWTDDEITNFNTQILPTYYLVSYRIHGETQTRGTGLTDYNFYSMTPQVGGTLDSVSQYPNGNVALLSNYERSGCNLDFTGNTLYDFKVTSYSVIQTQTGTITTQNEGYWDTNDGDGYSMRSADLGSLAPITVTNSFNSINRQDIITTNWKSLVGANYYRIFFVLKGGQQNSFITSSNTYPTPDTDNSTEYSFPYAFDNINSLSSDLLQVIVVAFSDINGKFSSSSRSSEFINLPSQ